MNAGINLPQGVSASQLLQQMLSETATNYGVLSPFVDGLTRDNLGSRLVSVEAARADDPKRVDIARFMTDYSQDRLEYQADGAASVPLPEYMQGRVDPLPLEADMLGGRGGLIPRIPYNGGIFEGQQIAELAQDLRDRNVASRAAVEALQLVAERGEIDLTGRKFVIFGAGAELAPTEVLLLAGATVLWIDRVSPEKFIADRTIQSGVIVYPSEGADLLTQPREIVATVEEFAAGNPVDIGAFAYIGGEAREWRLTAAMNAIIRRLPPQIVCSLSLYISPTAPAEIQPEDAVVALGRSANPFAWERLMKQAGILRPNLHPYGGRHWGDAVVSMQGSSYLAAQYVEKRLAAEVFAIRGIGSSEVARPVTVSANVAGITDTRSMKVPTFQAGFAGAPSLGLETYEPETTRWLSALLLLHDLLNPNAPGQASVLYENEIEKASALFSEQVHGGVYAHPFAIEGALKIAAAVGFVKRPRLLLAAIRGKK